MYIHTAKFTVSIAGLDILEFSCDGPTPEHCVTKQLHDIGFIDRVGSEKARSITRAFVYLSNEPCASSLKLDNGLTISIERGV